MTLVVGMGQRQRRQRNKGQCGAATLEFTLVGGVLILLAFALLDLGLLLNTKLVLTQAARTGLRQACVDGGASPRFWQIVQEQLQAGGIDPGAVQIAISPRNASYGTMISVSLAHDHHLRTPLATVVGNGAVRLRITLIGRSEFLGETGP